MSVVLTNMTNEGMYEWLHGPVFIHKWLLVGNEISFTLEYFVPNGHSRDLRHKERANRVHAGIYQQHTYIHDWIVLKHILTRFIFTYLALFTGNFTPRCKYALITCRCKEWLPWAWFSWGALSLGRSDIDVLYSDIPNTTDNLQLLTSHFTAGNSVVTKNIAYWGI